MAREKKISGFHTINYDERPATNAQLKEVWNFLGERRAEKQRTRKALQYGAAALLGGVVLGVAFSLFTIEIWLRVAVLVLR